MEQFFLQLGIMSLQACVVICVVLLARLLFEKLGVAKKYASALWMLPYLCMVCPWKFESTFGFWKQPRGNSLVTVQQVLTQAATENITAAGNTNFAHTAFGSTGIGNALESLTQSTGNVSAAYVTTADVVQFLLAMAGMIWFIGIVGLLIYSADAHLKLHRKLICCMHIKDNIYAADDIDVPFVLGVWKARIYLPSNIQKENLEYVIAHEKTHILHRDPMKKMLAFSITCLHWFNPLAWVAFYFLGKDIEMACDEETVQKLGKEHRQEYATALLTLSSGKKLFLGAPLAFDEGNVKSRIKNIVKDKKTLRIFSLIAVISIIVLTVTFMTKEREYVSLSEVQDMVHPSRESKNVAITLNSETRYFSGAGYVEEISDFLNDLEIKKFPQNRDENRSKDVVLEFGVQRFCFSADYDTIWSDSDVKSSFLYQVKNPEVVKVYLEGLFGAERVVSETLPTEGVSTEVPATETSTTELSRIEEGARGSEVRELTMEELIELCEIRPEVLAQTVEMIPWGEDGPTVPAIYNNLELGLNNAGEWNGNYFCYLSYEGKDYRVQFGFDVDTKALWGVYLYHPVSGDMILLYTDDPKRYTVNRDIKEFLSRGYSMDDYFTCTLPEGTWLGDFKIYYNYVFSGCPILGDYEEMIHAESAPEAWYVPGGMLVGVNDENNNCMQFENGKAVSVRWMGNHMWMEETQEYLEGCDMQAILCEVNFDLFTAAESYEYMLEHGLSEGELQTTSKYWYVFMGEEDSEYIYIVCLNQEYFTKEDVVELARSVQITYE